MNGGTPMPAALKTIPLSGMSTWQYYERDAVGPLDPAIRAVRPTSSLCNPRTGMGSIQPTACAATLPSRWFQPPQSVRRH